MRRILFNSLQFFSKNKYLFFFIITLILIILFTYKDYGVAWDEKDNRIFGNQAFSYYSSLGIDRSYFFSWKKEFLLSRGPFIETLVQIPINFSQNHSFEFYHLILALFSFISFYFLYKTVILLTKDKLISLSSIILLLVMPRFYGDIFNNSKDIPPIYFLLGITYFSVKILIGKGKLIDYIFLGIIGGVASGQRAILIYSLVLFIIFYLISNFTNNRNTSKKMWKKTILQMLFFFVSFLSFFYLFQPYLHINPFGGLYEMYLSSQKYEFTRDILFDGQIILSTKLPWYYIPKWILISTPIITLIFFFIGILYSLKKIPDFKKDKIILSNLFIVSLFFLPFLIIAITKPVLYDAWRHFLFLTSPLIIIATFGLYSLMRKKNYIRTIAVILLIFNILITAREMIILHPYEYIYFNSLVGGLNGAYKNYDDDYWGKSFKESIEWLKNNEIKGKYKKIYATGDTTSSTYYFSKNMKFAKLDEADYFVSYKRFSDHLLIDDSKTIYVVKRHDAQLNYVKKMK